jgi:Flp pilus assembly protein TadG
MKRTSGLRRSATQRGQGLVEMGIVVLLMVTLAMGIVEFGRILLILNMVTNATRDAARAAAAMGRFDRSSANAHLCTNPMNAIKDMVVNQMNGYITITRSNVTVEYPTPAAGAVQTVLVRTNVNVPYIALFNLVGHSLPVNRTVTFRDEVVAGGNGC